MQWRSSGLLLVGFGLAACGGHSTSKKDTLQTAPAAVGSAPVRVAAGERSATQLTITLSAPVGTERLDDLTVYVDSDANPGGRFEPWPGSWTLVGAKLTFSPRVPFPAAHEIRVSLPALSGPHGTLQALGLAPVSFPNADPDAIGDVRLAARPTAAGTTSSDDHGDSSADATPLTLNQALAGEVEVAGDRDWFSLNLRAGVEYDLSVSTVGDSTLGVFDSSGTRLDFNDDDPSGGLSSRSTFTPSQSGRYDLEVRAYGSGTLSYSVSATPDKAASASGPSRIPADDHGDDAASATAWTGAAIRGPVGAAGDLDAFLVQLVGGDTYTFRTETTGDTTLRVADDRGTQLGFNDDAPGGGRESLVVLRAPRDGVYLVVVAGYGDQQPSYTLRSRADTALTPERFQERAGTDVWHIDFELRRDLFDADMGLHGLRSGDLETDRLMRRRVISLVLSDLGQKFGLDEQGQPIAGLSLRISFSSDRPTGRVGRDYSREAVGGRHEDSTGTLGVSYLDPGNRRAEDNSRLGQLGIFTQVIYGSRSRLSSRLRASDRRYLDGSYALGDGTSSDDRRFRLIRDVSADWAHAISVVTAHEVGHSVGLNHDESDRRGVMQSALSRFVLSDRRTAFGRATSRTLETNLGLD